MNDQLQQLARKKLKDDLALCTPDQQHIFKRMYSPKDLDADINTVVDRMEAEKLDWAMQQVQRTLSKGEPT